MYLLTSFFALFLAALASFTSGASVQKRLTSSLQQITSGFTNPTNVGFYVYKPTTVTTNPALIVALHECTVTGPGYFSGSPYAQLADQYGFIVIYPSSPHSGTCWDVSSKATLTHNGGGDSNSIANMVTYAISTWNVDSTRVFVTGSSSGAMMTNVMAATYPEMFAAGTVYSGVAAGCFVSSTGGVDAWNSSCAEGQVDESAQQWANTVFAMYPGYTGSYPKMQEYHGTADTTLFPPNLNEEVKEWCGVFGYSATAPTTVQDNTPLPGYTKSVYGPNLQGILAQGVGHTVPIQGDQDMEWFGITGGGASVPAGPTSTVPTSTSTASAPGQTLYGQCGGIGWAGPTSCASGSCKASNSYYSQCLP
ncbi:acetyl xylan esterase [Stereum hirsutum FP-91666 SS1]|uniref:acetyl xylan esterase n=1 Tax=Stereum hirsutum (strain FP-91666) TaxID=721885 RepID=UPI000440AC0A|nr:acetyl xylan esterase [Stereum hirsutum FP-91666 SS1]EIM92932.1 acetyl xylan esterase [Stereum hirsutum FP-91666 SS1]